MDNDKHLHDCEAQIRNIKLSMEFMAVLHTFDMAAVKRTKEYKRMLAAVGGDSDCLDSAILEMMQKIKEFFAADPDTAAAATEQFDSWRKTNN